MTWNELFCSAESFDTVQRYDAVLLQMKACWSLQGLMICTELHIGLSQFLNSVRNISIKERTK